MKTIFVEYMGWETCHERDVKTGAADLARRQLCNANTHY